MNIKYFLIGLTVLVSSSCMDIPSEIKESLLMSNGNRSELLQVLRHYQKFGDSLKYKAACFLISNMHWHTTDKSPAYTEPQLEVFRQLTDSLYYQLLQDKKGDIDSLEPCRQELLKNYKWISDSIKKYKFPVPQPNWKVVSDLACFDSKFLINHIDHAFYLWKTSPATKDLNFDEFCEYLLPYRSTLLPTSRLNGSQLYQMYGKYILFNPQEQPINYIKRYNATIHAWQSFWNGRPAREPLGIYDLYYYGLDCAETARYGADILKACGIPVMVEFCYLYRSFGGRHFYCTARDSAGEWQTFNAVTSLPGQGDWVYSEPMNLYRQYFGAQKDTPYFLKNTNEYLPPLFQSPCIREITSERSPVFSVTLPFPEQTSNNLAYLGGFNVMESGISAITWGIIDKERQEVTFPNTMPNRLYFPFYYQGNKQIWFGEPFYIEKDSLQSTGFRIHHFSPDSSDQTTHLLLTRRGPQRPQMEDIARKLIGGRFTGANKRDFSDEKTLYTITKPPLPYFREYPVKHPAPYHYYRFIAPKDYPHANISMLEFLTDKKYGYKNAVPPTRTTILGPEEAKKSAKDTALVKLLDAPSWEKMKWKAEYDGNMKTAPGAYPTINLWLKEPQVVTRIRFAPRNADNGIHSGQSYQLYYWENGWQPAATQASQYEYIEFENIPANRIYWLRDNLPHEQEFLFIMKNGKQQFLYYDTINRKDE